MLTVKKAKSTKVERPHNLLMNGSFEVCQFQQRIPDRSAQEDAIICDLWKMSSYDAMAAVATLQSRSDGGVNYNGRSIPRIKIAAGRTATVAGSGDGGIQLHVRQSTVGEGVLIPGDTYAFSALVRVNRSMFVDLRFNDQAGEMVKPVANEWTRISLRVQAMSKSATVKIVFTGFAANSSDVVYIAEAQLTRGALVLPFEYTDVGTELAKILPYYEVFHSGDIGSGYMMSATLGYFTLNFSPKTSIFPTLSYSGKFSLPYGTFTSLGYEKVNFNSARMKVVMTGGTAGRAFSLIPELSTGDDGVIFVEVGETSGKTRIGNV